MPLRQEGGGGGLPPPFSPALGCGKASPGANIQVIDGIWQIDISV